MQEAKLVFQREGIEGVVPVGTYLSDAARRLGLKGIECDLSADEHNCQFEITDGAELLSERTQAESARIKKENANGNCRFACFAIIERPGEITIMTAKKKDEAKGEEPASAEEFKKAFTEMPLQEKLSKLVELEAIALTDTLSFVLNSPYTVADKLMGVMADFGLKKEAAEKTAARPSDTAAKNEKAASSKGKRQPKHGPADTAEAAEG